MAIPTASVLSSALRGALDWRHRFREAVAPVFDVLYKSVIDGKETEIVMKANSAPDYRERLQKELDQMKSSEMWRTGVTVRSLRPENRKGT